MVSFQCEGCGDVQTKKKLDSHRNHCHSPFTCIDCMTTFHGTEYRSHTSCMTEDQKYQGHLYREKANKASKRKSVSILEPNENNALVPRKATVEDEESEIPPHVPTPPPAVAPLIKNGDSVFDYLVEDEDPNTPQAQFTDEREEMFMKSNAPGIFNSRPTSRNGYRNSEEQLYTKEYEENGFTYGTEPVLARPANMNFSTTTLDFMTPAAKVAKAKLDRFVPESAGHSRQNSNSEKKRKRAQTDDHIVDTVMPDVPSTITRSVVETPGVNHSGLTGGLQRMMSEKDDKFAFPQSPRSSPDPDRRALTKIKPGKSSKHVEQDPQSPLKRSRRSKEDDPNGLGISIKGRAGRVMSAINGALSTNAEGAVGKSSSRRRGSSSDAQANGAVRAPDSERRERKKHRVSRHNGTSRDNVRIEHSTRGKSSNRRNGSESPDTPKQRNGKSTQRAIEYHPQNKHAYSPSDSDDDRRGEQQMVVFGAEERLLRKCEDFLAYITENSGGPRGYSINKTLKRYHKDSDIRKDNEKRDEEKELWKGLRLRRNDRGEVVIFVG